MEKQDLIPEIDKEFDKIYQGYIKEIDEVTLTASDILTVNEDILRLLENLRTLINKDDQSDIVLIIEECSFLIPQLQHKEQEVIYKLEAIQKHYEAIAKTREVFQEVLVKSLEEENVEEEVQANGRKLFKVKKSGIIDSLLKIFV